MIKCFLSHSSKDKSHYIQVVASRIRKEALIYDEITFEAGMGAAEEIINGLDETSLFVFFISNSALESKWVKEELRSAKIRLDDRKIERIYPIIIEAGLDHDDPRIPDWMKDQLNIQPILKPTVAARKINSRLIELSWTHHPKLKQRRQIFVGRNELTEQIERRLDDYSLPTPVVMIASGLPAIGRKALLQHAARKATLVRDSYEFPMISLSAHDGIEDFVLKIADLGFVPTTFSDIKLAKTFSDKIELAKQVCDQITQEHERLLVEDRGVLIQSDRNLVDWFDEIINYLAKKDSLTIYIASQFRPDNSINRTNPLVFSIHVPELDKFERIGLLGRYAKFHELALPKEDMSFFSDLLTGYPEQVLYTVDLINEHGVIGARQQSHTIQQYASEKAKVILDGYQNDPIGLNFIYFLSRFEFISYNTLSEIVDLEKYGPILDKLLSISVCERLGVTSDYIRVNEVIRDYIARSRFRASTEFESAVEKHVKNFLANYEDDNSDISDYIFSAQELLKQGKDIPGDMVLPSVFINAIKRLYSTRDYKEALKLIDRVLSGEKYLHENTVKHVRYIKCQCLARLQDGTFFAEVQKIPESDKSLLHGFYYRLSGQHEKAEESLKRVIAYGRRDANVVGELVLVYMQSDEYGLAYELAKENYRLRPANPINANNYFACLITKEKNSERRQELEQIIQGLKRDPSERAQEMYYSAHARLQAYYDDDENASFETIKEAIHRFPDISYPILTKADLAVYFNNRKELRDAVGDLENLVGRNQQTYRSLIRYKAMLLAMNGEVSTAVTLVEKELRGQIKSSKARLIEKLHSLHQFHK